MARLALALLMFTGARRSEEVRLGSHVHDGSLSWVPYKGRNKEPVEISIPILPELRSVIEMATDRWRENFPCDRS
jgi:hypothetical protein